jgi:hypothetical protein
MSLRKNLKLAQLYASSWVRQRRQIELFDGIETYCMFVGYPRTGHSLIGSLLDAHPNIVIAHELDALNLLKRGFSRNQLFHLLLENSRQMAAAGRRHSGYSYEVPNQWQGRFTSLKVIGDKKGATSAMHLFRNPKLFDLLERKIDKQLKLVHVIRNPYDVLSTMTRRSPRRSLEDNLEIFFQLCSTIAALKRRLQPRQLFDLHLETFIAAPRPVLADLCSFLQMEADPAYLEDSAAIVFNSPKKSRFDLDWPRDTISKVAERMAPYEFLATYRFVEDDADPVVSRPPIGLES